MTLARSRTMETNKRDARLASKVQPQLNDFYYKLYFLILIM
jgi:hypothetical protein